MIFTTERTKAETETKAIMKAAMDSGLDFYITESAYSLNLSVKKQYLKDNSKHIYESETESLSLSSSMKSPHHPGHPGSPMFSPTSTPATKDSDEMSNLKSKIKSQNAQIQSQTKENSNKNIEIEQLNSKLAANINTLKVVGHKIEKVPKKSKSPQFTRTQACLSFFLKKIKNTQVHKYTGLSLFLNKNL